MTRRPSVAPLLLVLLVTVLAAGVAHAQRVDVQEFTLDNGMKFLLVPRADQPNSISAGWVAKVGSVNERPGITGISHFFEHMMFKGTTTIGTRDPQRDAELMRQQTDVHTKILHEVWNTQYQRFRDGEIDDPWDPASDTPRLAELRAELKRLIDEHAKIIVKNEFDAIYTRHGASGLNAFTANDLTFYFVTIPSNKFELWAWMESDRLHDSVFREFYAERDVVHEERRLRTESTPTGVFQEQFDAMFWQSSPYAWPVIGWTSDLNSYTMEEAQRYFDIYYRPSNLVGVIVGDFDPNAVRPAIEEYFGRLKRGATPPPPVVTLEMPQTTEKRLYAMCDCQPQVEIRYHSVPFGHADSNALEVLAEILNGRTGRLYRLMVEGTDERPGIASSASASAGGLGEPAKYHSFFAIRAEVKGQADPEDLEALWYEELDRLKRERVDAKELQKVKNQIAADAYRSLQSNFFLMLQLGVYEGLGDWRHINESPTKLQAVTAADIQRVAGTYFDWSNRSVAIYLRKEAATAPADDDPALAALDPQMRAQVERNLRVLLAKTDPAELRMIIGRLEGTKEMIAARPDTPAGTTEALDYMVRKLKEHLASLENAAPKPE